ncbi:hypothetical protein HJFPF1_07496 [Paramyrothecium foliicola]|nr:hypothetical protein HJFPF1_07496 [Paramyrothecium foliicola]
MPFCFTLTDAAIGVGLFEKCAPQPAVSMPSGCTSKVIQNWTNFEALSSWLELTGNGGTSPQTPSLCGDEDENTDDCRNYPNP